MNYIDLLLSSDGIMAYFDFFSDTTQWGFSLRYGKSRLGNDIRKRVFIAEFDGNFRNTKTMGLHIYYDNLNALRSFALSVNNNSSEFQLNTLTQSETSSTDKEITGDFDANQLTLSFEQQIHSWTFTAEFQTTKLDSLNINNRGEGYYIQTSKRMRADASVFFRWDVNYQDANDRNGKKYEAKRGLPAYLNFSKIATLGLRHDLNRNMMLNFEYHYVNGGAFLSLFEHNPASGIERYWNFAVCAFSVRF